MVNPSDFATPLIVAVLVFLVLGNVFRYFRGTRPAGRAAGLTLTVAFALDYLGRWGAWNSGHVMAYGGSLILVAILFFLFWRQGDLRGTQPSTRVLVIVLLIPATMIGGMVLFALSDNVGGWIVEWVVGWIIFSLVVGWVWNARSLSFGMGVLLSMLLSPVVGLIIGLVKKPDQALVEQKELSTGDKRKCPFCAELIKREAIVCRFCGKDLPLMAPSPPGTNLG